MQKPHLPDKDVIQMAVNDTELVTEATSDIVNDMLDQSPRRSRGRPRKYPKLEHDAPSLSITDLSPQKDREPFSPSRGINAGFRAVSPSKHLDFGDAFNPCADIKPGSSLLANGKLWSQSKMSAYIPALLEDRSRKVGDIVPIKHKDQTTLVVLSSTFNPIWPTQGEPLQNIPVAGYVQLESREPNHNSFFPVPLVPSSGLHVDDSIKHRWERLKSMATENSNLALASSIVLVPELGKAELQRGGHPDYDFPVHYRPLRFGYKPEETRYVTDPLFELEIERMRRAKWTNDEVARFERGLATYGKEFYRVMQVVQGVRLSDFNLAWKELKQVADQVNEHCALARYDRKFGANEQWFDKPLVTGTYLGIAGAVSPIPLRPLLSSKSFADCVQFYYLHKHSLESLKRAADEKRFNKEMEKYKLAATNSVDVIKMTLAQMSNSAS
jgi:hypothetical protein